MRRWRGNWLAPSTRWRSRRRRREKPSRPTRHQASASASPMTKGNASKRRSCPLRLLFLDLGLASDRGDPQRGDAVAFAAQDAEAEAVEGETLAAFRDRARLVDHKACDRGRLLVGKMPVHRAVEIADRHRAVDHHRAVK